MTKRNRIPAAKETGFVTVSTAIILTVLLMCAALALDVSIWFARANELQRTADAAALAGVVKMPDEVAASNAAIEIAGKNRVSAANVEVNALPDSPRELRVSVTDPKVRSFFGRFVNDGIVLTRSATAEYVPKIELGSRLNAIGTGNLTGWGPGGTEQNFWLAINGKCSPREDGDLYASAFDGNRQRLGSIRCDSVGALKNLEYRTESTTEPAALNQPSYTYIVEIPCPTAPVGGVCPTAVDGRIDVYHPYFDNSGTGIDQNMVNRTVNPLLAANAGFDTVFRIRDAYGNPLPGNIALQSVAFPKCTNCSGTNDQWTQMFQVTQAGKYRIDVSTVGAVGEAYGSNAFALRVWTDDPDGPGPVVGTGPALCAIEPCPTIAGQSSMSVYAKGSGATADLYLARLAPARYYRGKKVQVLLFDPGEGALSIQILRPSASGYQPIPFRYRTITPGLALGSDPSNAPLGDSGISGSTPVTELLVNEVGTTLPFAQQAPWWGGNPPANDSKYNGRMVSVEIQIPAGYGCVAGNIPCVEASLPEDGWWKIRYNTAAGVSDRTTWSVRMFGDPVHLTSG
jgi:Putative Flp pilus-assembly TadE/G-like